MLKENLKFKEQKEYIIGYSKKPQKQEKFEIFNDNDKAIMINGKKLLLYREECHGPKRIKNIYHRGVNILVINNNEIYIPIRSPKKDLYSNYKDFSTSEHLKIGESYVDAAVRGIAEELNKKIDKKDLKFLTKRKVDDINQNEHAEYYVYYSKNKDFTFNDEVEKGKWYNLSELKELLTDKQKLADFKFRPDHLPVFLDFLKNN